MHQPNSYGRLTALANTSALTLGPQTALLPGCLFHLYINEDGNPMTALVTGVVADVVDHGKGIRGTQLLIVVAAGETHPKCRELFLRQVNLLKSAMVQKVRDARIQPVYPPEKRQRVVYTEEWCQYWCQGASEAYDGAIYVRINELTTLADIDLSIPNMQGFLPFEAEIQESQSTHFAPGTHILCKVNPFRLDHISQAGGIKRTFNALLNRTGFALHTLESVDKRSNNRVIANNRVFRN
ncbi:hypothetical protein B0H11DRAFT_1907044 [Mycena galericulata]|nr:hypothetical protein B0H11DRAFT_1907044 [Mycena galericulata]